MKPARVWIPIVLLMAAQAGLGEWLQGRGPSNNGMAVTGAPLRWDVSLPATRRASTQP